MTLWLALSSAPSGAWLEEAHALMKDLRFGEALKRLEVARQAPSLTPEALREVLESSAYCQVAEGKWLAAEASWTELLLATPDAEPRAGLSSPKALSVYQKVKHKLFPNDYVRLEEREAPAGVLRVAAIDPWKRVAVVVLRARSQDTWAEMALAQKDGLWTHLGTDLRTRVEWYLEARAVNGDVLARLASADAPRVWAPVAESAPVMNPPLAPAAREQVSAPATPGLTRRAGGFALLGVGLALAGVATGLQVSGIGKRQAARNPNQPPGDFAATALAAESAGIAEQRWSAGLFGGAGLFLAVGAMVVW